MGIVEAIRRKGLDGPGCSCSIPDGSSGKATEGVRVALMGTDRQLSGLNPWFAHRHSKDP